MTQGVVDYMMWHHFGRNPEERNHDLAQVCQNQLENLLVASPITIIQMHQVFKAQSRTNVIHRTPNISDVQITFRTIRKSNQSGDAHQLVHASHWSEYWSNTISHSAIVEHIKNAGYQYNWRSITTFRGHCHSQWSSRSNEFILDEGESRAVHLPDWQLIVAFFIFRLTHAPWCWKNSRPNWPKHFGYFYKAKVLQHAKTDDIALWLMLDESYQQYTQKPETKPNKFRTNWIERKIMATILWYFCRLHLSWFLFERESTSIH